MGQVFTPGRHNDRGETLEDRREQSKASQTSGGHEASIRDLVVSMGQTPLKSSVAELV